MSSRRLCVVLLLMCVQSQVIIGKPLFAELFCDYMCDDDDDDGTTTSSSTEDDLFDFFDICSCPTRRPNATRQNQMNMPSNINLRLPPSPNGLNLNMTNSNGVWSLNVDAGPNGSGAGGPATPGPTTLPPTTAAEATTAAGTTAAATTAKK